MVTNDEDKMKEISNSLTQEVSNIETVTKELKKQLESAQKTKDQQKFWYEKEERERTKFLKKLLKN